jgi:two-component system, NtrC family, sensor kinase
MKAIETTARRYGMVPPQVLVLEDEATMADQLELALKDEGYGVQMSSTGQSALKTLGKKGFDLFIADLNLPDMDGMDVIRRVKEGRPDTKVIVITGYPTIPSAIEAMKTGVVDYLPKPFTYDELMTTIKEALKREPAVPEAPSGELVEAHVENLIPKGEVIRALKRATEDDAYLHQLAERTRITPGDLSHMAEHMHELSEEKLALLCKRLQCNVSASTASSGEEETAADSALEWAAEPSSAVSSFEDYTTLMEEKWMDTAEQLARSFNFQNKLIESSIDGIIACDNEGRIVVFNSSMEKMLGYTRQEVINKMYLDRFFPIAGVEEIKKMLCSDDYGGKNRVFLYDTNVLDKTGMKIPVQLSAAFLYEDQNEIGMVAFLRDLRESRKVEMQYADQASLIHQDKMVSMGKLAASIAHEINNPLAGVLNYVRLMLRVLGRGETLTPENLTKFQRYLELVESETSRCSTIISSLLAFSRKSKMETREVNINELIEKSVLLCRHKLDLQNIRVEVQLSQKMSPVYADFNQMQQCLINLILNAMDAMAEGGVLTVRSIVDEKGGTVKIEIRDTGCGIPKEDLARIFDPFYTTKKEGSGLGLGLSTVFGIVDRHKGTISVDSEPDKGTAFTITLPVANIGGRSKF